MKIHYTSLSAVALFAASCCGTALAGPSTSPSPQQFDAITLSRSPCRGDCPAYTVTVFSDGRVKYTSGIPARFSGPHENIVSKNELELLAATLRYVKFTELRDQYLFQTDGCAGVFSDLSSQRISLDAGGTKKEVVINFGCMGANVPTDQLTWLGRTIDFVAGSARPASASDK